VAARWGAGIEPSIEAALKEVEERFRAIIEFAADAMVIVDAAGQIVLVNAEAEKLFGYPRCEMQGKPIELLLPERFREGHVELRNNYLAAPYPRPMRNTPNLLARRKNGSECPVEISLSPLQTDCVTLCVVSVRDISERKQAEVERTRLLDAAERQRSQLEMILDSVPALIFYKDLESRLVHVNAAHAQFFGLPRQQIEGRTDAELGSPFASQYLRDDLQVMTSGEPLRGLIEQFQTPSGVHWLQTEKVPHRDDQGRVVGLVGIAVDITDRMHLEEQLRQAQKMEAIGRLAGGVAHDFNNLLTIINGYSELLLENASDDDPRKSLFQEIKKAGERAAGLTHQLLAFSRKQVLEPRVLCLNQQVLNLEKMLRRLIGEHIQIHTVLEPHLWAVMADAGQIAQVIMNLALNARDAMPKGGELRIQTTNVDTRTSEAVLPAELPAGRFVMLSVTDTGCGMDENTRARIFEPFFTTKAEGLGTGLGLAVVYGIVAQSGGSIDVISELNCGTSFRIFLPSHEHAVPASESHHEGSTSRHGTETVLLVEDEEVVRHLASNVLRQSGYTVLEAANGDEGLRVFESNFEMIHLLVTDVIMPGMSGPELAEQLTNLRAGLKVLFLSGYTDDALHLEDSDTSATGFLQKPFTPSTLSRKVRDMLDAPGPSTDAPPAQTCLLAECS
jgi:PAS domain S-box-containing protein